MVIIAPLEVWDLKQSEVRLNILQVLNAAKSQGAPGKLIADCLQIQDMALLMKSLTWLGKKHFIRMDEKAFFITDEGLAYLREQLPDIDFPDAGGGPQSSGPDDPPKVPKSPLVPSGAGAVELPIADSKSETQRTEDSNRATTSKFSRHHI
ncbi:unnamed protein product [Sphagnum balticum]